MSGYGRINIEEVVRALGVPHVTVIRPYRIKKSIEAVREALHFKGVSVVIAKEMCTLYAKSLRKPPGKPFHIGDRCKGHRLCVNELACPAFYIKDGRVHIDPLLCTGCAVCVQICPENAIVPLKDNK